MKKVVKKIAITGASGQIAYQLLFRLAAGDMFGIQQPVEIHLLEIESMLEALKGVVMELEDGAYPLLEKVTFSSKPEEAFSDVDVAILIGAKPRGPGMERKELLQSNAEIFVHQGAAIDKYAKKTVQVLVVGNPCNTNCLIAIHQLKRILPTHFHAMTRLDYNRAIFHLAKRLKQPFSAVHNMVIWGNHSSTQVPDVVNANCYKKPIMEYLSRDELENEFIPMVQTRGAEVIKVRGKSSSGSAAQAIIDAIKSIHEVQGHPYCSGILGKNNPYGIDPELVFSYPLISQGNGFYQIRGGFLFDAIMEERIKKTEKELLEERELVSKFLRIY
jgi:malate dehydrogenase